LTLLYKHFTKGDYKHMVSHHSDIKLSRLEYQFGQEAIQIRIAIHEINTACFWSSSLISTIGTF